MEERKNSMRNIAIEYTWKKNEKERRVVFRSARCIIYPVVRVCSGRSLVEAMPSQQRPLSTPDMFNPSCPLSPHHLSSLAYAQRERDTWRTRYRRTHTHTHTREACTQRLTLSFAPWGRPLSNRKPQRATALIKRAIDRHYR